MYNGPQQITNIIIIALVLLLLMSAAIVIFFYLSRKRIVKTQLEKANLEIAHQKEMLQATIIVQEEERKRIAQDLHDAISSKLNIVSLNANMLSESGIPSEETNKIADSILQVTATVLESSRQIAHDLLPPTLEKFGLKAALEELCEEVSESGTFKVTYELADTQNTLTSSKALHLFRIAQELFSNSLKYSKATSLSLSLQANENIISLHYKDDGKGFDLSEAKKAKGLGMLGIENRVQILEATYSIETSPGKGMAVLVSVPVN
ncbi:MAG: sensor histidine kinase [Flavobacteriales bacterium]|jgi:signal transduction histidine kinase|nr:sensor histidine kinase [Flavobacteriales bacterium]